ncbi:MAG: hypothetical protein ACE5GE_00655 [Phycisphaerae bacterium]
MSKHLASAAVGLVLSSVAPWAALAQDQPSHDVRAALEFAATLLAADMPEKALRTLNEVQRREPNNPWLGFYRGTAHVQLGAPYAAMESFDRSLEILASLGDPDPELAERIGRLRSQARRQVFGVSFSLGLAYDTNVTFLGDAGTLDIIANQPDGRFGSSLRIDFAPLADREQTLTFGARLSHSWHFGIEQFNFQDYGGYLRYAHRLGRRWELSLQYDYDLSYLGNEPFLSSHGLTPAVTYRWPVSANPLSLRETSIFYRFGAQDYLFEVDPAFDRDGIRHAVGIEQRLDLRPIRNADWLWSLSAGYRFESFATDGSEFDRFGHNFHLGVEVPLVNPANPAEYLLLPDKELLFGFTADWQLNHYRNRSLSDENSGRRSDLITTLGFSLSQTLIDDPDLGQLVLHTVINWTNANSNVTTQDRVSPFTYDKLIYGVQLAWSW